MISIVIPARDEAENIVSTLRGVAMASSTPDYEAIVVVDDLQDLTVRAVALGEFARVRCVENRYGPGPAGAIKTGFVEARGDSIVVMMADGSDDPRTIPLMLDMRRAGYDIVCATRHGKGGERVGGPRVKEYLSRAAGWTLATWLDFPTSDPTNNFRLYSRRVIEATFIDPATEGFELGLEIVVKARAAGFRIGDVPTTWRDRTFGTSKFKFFSWLPRYIKWWREAFRVPGSG